MNELYKRYYIDIYEHNFELVVCDEIGPSRNSKKRKKILDHYDVRNAQGLSTLKDRNLFIFLRSDSIEHNLIAHEVAHVVHYLFANIGQKIDPMNNEEFAYMAGYLTNLIYKQLKKWKIRVK